MARKSFSALELSPMKFTVGFFLVTSGIGLGAHFLLNACDNRETAPKTAPAMKPSAPKTGI